MRKALVLAGVLLAGCSDSGGSGESGDPVPPPPVSSVPSAVLAGPIGDAGLRGHALWDSWFDLSELGYAEDEYFASGTARSHPAGSEAPYVTRIIVRRPLDAAHFNGTVLLDWVNVTAQFENAVDTIESHEMFHREGFAYVHVSAQAAGVCCTPLTPKTWDPVRYMELSHPGDAYAYDMFSQIAQALRRPGAVDAMGGLPVRRIIAMGQSQSGTRLHTYLNEVQVSAGVIDAFLIHADGAGNKNYVAEPPVPVIQLLSEREASPAAPNVSRNYRLWELAGGAHQDFWIGWHQVVGQGPRVTAGAPRMPASADAELHATAGNYGEQLHPAQMACVLAGAQFPMRYAVSAALLHLDRWLATGAEPPQGPRFEFTAAGALARDADGNALGGIRLPPIEVPVARYRSADCNLGGITIPFTDPELAQRYPTHADYYCRMKAATARSVAAGFLLPADADELLARVQNAANRWLDAGTPVC